MRDGHQPPSSKKILERPSENCIPHPNRSFFLRGFWVKRRRVAALAFPVLLVDEKEPTIHGDCLTIFLKNISQGSPIQFAWYLSKQILGAWSCLNIHRVSSTEGKHACTVSRHSRMVHCYHSVHASRMGMGSRQELYSNMSGICMWGLLRAGRVFFVLY